MAEVEIKFMPMFKIAMLEGRKVCTSRNNPVAKAGDTFEMFGAQFEVTGVGQLPLRDVARNHWKEEGADSPEHFLTIWKRTQWGREPDLDRIVNLHIFRRLETQP